MLIAHSQNGCAIFNGLGKNGRLFFLNTKQKSTKIKFKEKNYEIIKKINKRRFKR